MPLEDQLPPLRILRPWPPRPHERAWKVCVSGGIGSGKSSFTQALGACGGVIFDADAVLHRATALDGVALAAIREAFGPSVFMGHDSGSNTLDRQALAALIFTDSGAKARLEGILHPLLWQVLDQVVAELPPEAILVAEIPLITETGNVGRFDVVVMVDAPHETRIKRLTASRGMSETSARERIAAQATRAQREAIAHVWVENTGSKADLENAARQLWGIWLKCE